MFRSKHRLAGYHSKKVNPRQGRKGFSTGPHKLFYAGKRIDVGIRKEKRGHEFVHKPVIAWKVNAGHAVANIMRLLAMIFRKQGQIRSGRPAHSFLFSSSVGSTSGRFSICPASTTSLHLPQTPFPRRTHSGERRRSGPHPEASCPRIPGLFSVRQENDVMRISGIRFFHLILGIQTFFPLAQKPDRAGWTKLAVDIRVLAFETLFT
jgi:hypothetical protein